MFRHIVIVCLMIVLIAPAGLAQQGAGVKELSLGDVSELALQNNFDIQLTKYDIRISRQGVDAARSIYDMMLSASIGYSDDRSAKNSSLLDDRTTSREYSVGLSKTLPSGTTVSVQHDADRGRADPGTSLFYNPDYESSVALTIEQDLGRNFFGLQDRGDVTVAMHDVENATHLSLDKIEQSLANVQQAYWGLVLAQDLYDLQQEFLEQAKRLYDVDQERFTHGLVEKPQLLGTEANYQQQWAAVYLAKDQLKAQENVLKLQLNISEDKAVALKPIEGFELKQQGVSLEASLKKAFEFRRDYLQALNEIDRRDILLSMKKNDLWPEINLELSLERNGLDDGYGDAFAKIADEDNPTFSASLAVSVPLENRDAKSAMKQAEYEKAKALLNVKYLERKIAIEIVDQVRKCAMLYERLVAVKKAADLQAQKVAEQEKIFHQGRSDSDTVIRYQEDALTAQVSAANAFYDYYGALIDLKRKEGTLLAQYWDGEI